MEITEIGQFIQIFNHLPVEWKITFIICFFLLPKLISTVGGASAVKAFFSAIGMTLSDVIRNYQARKQMQAEDVALTDAYTRTLVVESLSMFAFRLERMDHKINWLVKRIDSTANLEKIEASRPVREKTDTIIHSRKDLVERMSKKD